MFMALSFIGGCVIGIGCSLIETGKDGGLIVSLLGGCICFIAGTLLQKN
jgi:hypothetical protein